MTFLPIHSQISLQKREPKKQRRSLIVSDSNPNTDSGPTGAGLLNHKCTHIHKVMGASHSHCKTCRNTSDTVSEKLHSATPLISHWQRKRVREQPKSKTHQDVVNRITVPNLELSIFTNSPATVSEEGEVVFHRARAYEQLRVNSGKNMRWMEIKTDGETKDEVSMWLCSLCVTLCVWAMD